MVRGMIIKEGLTDAGFLSHPMLRIVDRYPMRMDGMYPIEIVMVDVAESDLMAVLSRVAANLLPKKYYAHFVTMEHLYVVYPWTISLVPRDDAAAARRCVEVGWVFEVPEAQLPIEKMFNFGHAEHPD